MKDERVGYWAGRGVGCCSGEGWGARRGFGEFWRYPCWDDEIAMRCENLWYNIGMAKKRGKRKSYKEVGKEHELPGGFWRQVFAVGMIAFSVVLILSWLGGGGTALESVNEFALWLIGYAVYLIPFLLVYLAVKIFQSDDNKLPGAMWFATILMILWGAGLSGIPTFGTPKPTGGIIGEALNGVMTQILTPGPAVFIYGFLMFVTAIFILQVSPATVFRFCKSLFRTSQKVEDARNLKLLKSNDVKKSPAQFKINTGVESSENVPTGGDSRLQNASKASKMTSLSSKAPDAPQNASGGVAETDKALVAVSDPNWKKPPLDLLQKKQSPADAGNIQQNAAIIKTTLAAFGIEVEMEGANIGPRVTQYTMKPPSGVNLSKILSRDKELALNLAVDKIRIEAPIPGTSSVGVEIPNIKPADVGLRSILESKEWKNNTESLVFAVGKDISGKAVIANLARMPHLLIAGTTGSGKSVMTNTLISSLLYRNAPSDMKLIIVDPKRVEMAMYEDIPHLLTPVITAPEETLSAMKWAVNEMERRYTLMAEEKVKNIKDYNAKMLRTNGKVAQTDPASGLEQTYEGGRMPYIVIIIDEMADLMMMAGKDLEMLIVRIAQKGRASGIHMVLATQRPEVKVITGLIKANFPGRIAFAVGSQMDSRIMLDMGGAEKLLGTGDMLLLTTEMMGKPRRIQGAWVDDKEVAKVTDFLREQQPPQYNEDVISQPVQIKGIGPTTSGITEMGRQYDPKDPLVRKAVELSIKNGKFSTAMLQTWLGKGHGYVSGLAIWLEEVGVIGPPNGNKPRDVLVKSLEEFETLVGM